MALAEWLPSFDKETLTLKILLAQCAVKALRMIVIVEGFHPPVPSFYWESAGDTFCCEQFVPIFFTVGESILEIERRVCENFTTIGAGKAFRVEVLTHGFQTVPNDFLSAFFTIWCEISAVTIFTVELTFLLYKTHVLQ